MELYGGADLADVRRFDEFMSDYGIEIIGIDSTIMQVAAAIMAERRRLGRKIGLADAIIQATADDVRRLTIITRNTKDFRRQDVRVPYELKTVSTVTVINVIPPGDTPLPPPAGAASLKQAK